MGAQHIRTTVLALAAGVVLTGCAGTPGSGASPWDTARGATEVEVVNHNRMDMTIYATRLGRKHRLGTVTTGQRRSFELPPSIEAASGEVYLMADPIGSRDSFRSRPVPAFAGSTLVWSLENHLGLSSFTVR